MKKTLLSCLFGVLWCYLGGQLLLSCTSWDLPALKTLRNCVKPAGTLDAVSQQKQVSFSISNPSGTIEKVAWKFGNGSTTATTGQTVSYTYPTSGTYTVEATLSNACGLETTLSNRLVVSDAVLATVTLQAITVVANTSAQAGMTLTANGNATITRYGICYSATNQNPAEANDPKQEKTGEAALNTPIAFTLKDLAPNTFYYARSYAVNAAGTAYSSPQTFRTGQNPVITTNGTSSPGITTVSVNFVLSSAGSQPGILYGLCYSAVNSVPDLTNSTVVEVVNPPVATNAVVALTKLTPNTKYYYRPYAKLPSGEVIYGAVASFNTAVDAVAQGLIASVSFTNRSLLDETTNKNDVVLVDNPSFTTDRKGALNSAILLDGVNDYFFMADNSSLRPDAVSVSIWIKPITIINIDRTQNDRVQIFNKSRWNDSSGEMYSSLIKLNENGPGLTFMTDLKQSSNCRPGEDWLSFQFSSNPQLSTWHHLVLVYSGQSLRMYFDNVLVDQSDALPGSVLANCAGGELKFGAQIKAYPNYFNGAMDDIRIYNRMLSKDEVSTLFNQ